MYRAPLKSLPRENKQDEDMLKKGINPKYLSEMKMCDIQKMQMR